VFQISLFWDHTKVKELRGAANKGREKRLKSPIVFISEQLGNVQMFKEEGKGGQVSLRGRSCEKARGISLR